MDELLPIFYDTSSKKSILTTDRIIELCVEHDIKKPILVSTNFHTFVGAWKNCLKNNLNLVFGLEFWICNDPADKKNVEVEESKLIIFIKNHNGYKDLIRFYSAIYTDDNNKYYKYRASWNLLNLFWTNNLVLAFPWADSPVYQNTINLSTVVPKLPTDDLWIFREQKSGLPFQSIVDKALDNFNAEKRFNEIPVKTIYYEKEQDMAAWMVYRTITLRSTFQKPEMPYCSSRNFCFEDYLKLK